MTMDEGRRKHFDEQYAERDPWSLATSEYEQTKYQRQIRVLKEHLQDPDRILEIGCSEGIHSEMLLEAFPDANLLGIDISEQAIERARERLPTDRASFVAADAIEFLPTVEESFDAVVWSETIYYIGDSLSVPEMYEFVEEVFERIDHGGVLVTANIIGKERGLEERLTRPPVLSAYRKFLSAVGEPIHTSRYSEYKSESDSHYEYEIWAFRSPPD